MQPKFRIVLCAWVASAMCAATQSAPASGSAHSSAHRSLTLDDLLRLERLSEGGGRGIEHFSPDGTWLAYVLKRGQADALGNNTLQGYERADLWVVAAGASAVKRGAPQKLMDCSDKDCGTWQPTWSPDGQRLAFLSTRGGTVSPWVWNKAAGRIERLVEREVSFSFLDEPPLQWLSNHELAVVLVPEETPSATVPPQRIAAERVVQAWQNAWSGKETTASVVESGIARVSSDRSRQDLVLIDIREPQIRIATAASAHRIVNLLGAPGGRYVAYLQQSGEIPPRADVPLISYRTRAYSLGVVDAAGNAVSLDTGGVKHVLPRSLSWSADGTQIAFIEDPREAIPDGDIRIVRCQPSVPSCRVASVIPYRRLPGLIETHFAGMPQRTAWSARNDLLVQKRASDEEKHDAWWLVTSAGQEIRLTEGLDQVPPVLFREAGQDSLIGLAGGNLWRIHTDGRRPQDLSARFAVTVNALQWPMLNAAGARAAVSEIIVEIRNGNRMGLAMIDLSSLKLRPLPKPVSHAALRAYSPVRGAAVFSADDNTGTRLWRSSRTAGRFEQILETNTFLREITAGEVRHIEYTSLRGQPLNGWLILPPGYRAGTRYPLITWVHAGATFEGNHNRDRVNLIAGAEFSQQLIAAQGYAVLAPSMPSSTFGTAGDPMLELTSGVLPAVDKAIALGIADPDRLGLIGHSWGGFSTFGLITQTDRFKAAVASSGVSNLLTSYGQFMARARYSDSPTEELFRIANSESGQARMGSPPWADPERYIRNSPLFNVARVNTPLLITHGDLDYVPMQQSEEFFTALHRLGKRAEFVRYWGEDHTFSSAANVRDKWQRIFGWFEEFLKPTLSSPSTSRE